MTFIKTKAEPSTSEEKRWIRQFEKLAAKCPRSLWLYSANGKLWAMKTPENEQEMDERGYVNQDNIVGGPFNIRNDGGDW